MERIGEHREKWSSLSGVAISALGLAVLLAMLMLPVRLLAGTASKAQSLPMRTLAPMAHLQMQKEKGARSWAAADSCSVHGYVYYDGVPVAGASVHIESQYGTLDTTTDNGGGGSYPDYSTDLSSPPLLVSPGDSITVTASYNGRSASTAYEVASGEQQVDVPIVINPAPLFGDGSEGDLVVSGTYYVDDVRSALNGNANAGQKILGVVSTSGFFAGDEVLVHQTRGVGVGAYEFGVIANIGSGTLVLQRNLQNNYFVGGDSKAQVLRVPNYQNVTVQAGGTLTAHAWDEDTGGILAIVCTGNIEIFDDGTISVKGKGFGGGNGASGYPDQLGEQGEGEIGPSGSLDRNPNGAGGGGGGFGPDNHSRGGGGGGYGSGGQNGGGGSVEAGLGGYPWGQANMSIAGFGGGGGSGSHSHGGQGTAGGNGGGLILLSAQSIQLHSTNAIDTRGNNGVDTTVGGYSSAGGGGAGGGILLRSRLAELGSGYCIATGGEGGDGSEGDGGNGGIGRIRIEYSDILSGTTNPLANEWQWEFLTGPIVTIHTIYPDPAIPGQDVITFRGSAVDNDEDGASITQYVWRSDLDGLLSTQPAFTRTASSLSKGTHTIYFKAKDDEGEWSEEISATLTSVASPPAEDDYEPDDTCAQANDIATSGVSQYHTFHQEADKDWVQFTATAGITYVIQTANVGPDADTVLALFDFCNQPPLAESDNTFGSSARIVWACPADGTYYVRANNHDPYQYSSDAYYDLSVRGQIPGAAAIIVAGHNDAWDLQDNIDFCTNAAYLSFLQGGIPEDKLYYLNPHPNQQDPDGDGVYDDVADVSTTANLQYALESWAISQVGAGQQLFVYLMDHGATDAFATDGNSDITAPQMLDTWLHTVEDATGCVVNVIIEACHSGSFIDEIPALVEEISEPGRVIIASTGREQNAYASSQGAYFSDAFWTSIQNSNNLWVAFQDAVEAVKTIGKEQTPWLDDNGNVTPNDATDGQVAAGRGLASFFGGWPPVVDVVTVTLTSETEGVIQARVRDDYGVQAVWAIVMPPSFQEPPPGEPFEWPELGLPEVELQGSEGLYQHTYSSFDELGLYRVIVYARDMDDNQATPVVTLVRTGYIVYLPLIAK